MSRLICSTALALGTAMVATGSSARADGVAISRFEPSERGSRFYFADSLELGSTSSRSDARPLYAAGITASYARLQRTYGSLPEGERSHLVADALYLHPGASVAIAPGARFALDVPVVAYQKGEDTNLSGTFYPGPLSPRIGDIRASFDLALLGPRSRDRDGIALAGGVSAWLPTGSGANYAGDDSTRFGVRLAAAARHGWLLVAGRVGYMYRRDGYLGGSRIGSELNAVVGVAYDRDGWTVGPELAASGAIDAELAKRSTPVEVLAAAHRQLGSLRAGLGLGTSLVGGLGAPHVRAVFSLEWTAGARGDHPREDRDHDGVADDDDLCPDVAGLAGSPIDGASAGCPRAPLDRDRDGIPDSDDACPDAPGGFQHDPKAHGCPEPAPPPPEPPAPAPEP